MDGHVRPLLAHLHDQAGVGHDECVRPQRNHRLQIAQVAAHLVVVRIKVAGDKEFFAARVRLGDALGQLFQPEFVVACAQAVARLAGINGVGAKVIGGAHFFKAAGGQQQFWVFHAGDCLREAGRPLQSWLAIKQEANSGSQKWGLRFICAEILLLIKKQKSK